MNQAGYGRAPQASQTATAQASQEKKRSVGRHVLLIGTGLTIAAALTEAVSLGLACGAEIVTIVLAIIASIAFPVETSKAGTKPSAFGDSRTGMSLATLLCVFGMLAAIVIACKILGLFGDGLMSHYIRSITP